jgi:chemotaxis protein MotB
MSLQLLAKQMESKGRGGDSVLVHMTHGEVAGLQKLAESAGGSLSVNPDTGLVEANFLKSMLPTIVGLAVGVGTGNPMLGAAAGAAVGGYQARRNDQDVGLGMVMGGMGGYGGASLAGGLGAAAPAAAGAAPVSAAGSTVIPGAGAGIMAPNAAASIGAAPAAQAANVATQAATAPTMAENFARFGQGFQGMSTEAGRAAALKSMGGSQGVMNAMQLAALPALNAADAYDRTPGPHPLLSTDLNRTGGGAFQDIRAYEPAMPRYTAQKGNVFVPTFTAADGGSVAGDSGMSGGALPNDDANRIMLEKFPTMQKLIGQFSPRTLDRLGISEKEAPAPTPAPRQAAPELRAYEPEMPRYVYENGTYIPTFAAAVGGEVGFFSGGGTGQGGGLSSLAVANRPFIIDPATGNVIPNPNIQRPKPKTFSDMGIAGGMSGSGEFGYTPNPDFDTPEKQAAFYAENPTMGRFTRALQTPLGYFMDPQDFQREQNLTLGVTAPPSAGSGYVGGTQINDAELAVTAGGPAPAANLVGTPLGDLSPGGGIDYGGYSPTSDDASYGGFFAAGGLMSLAKGGMRSGGFVIPADVVSMVGEGNTDAGYKRIKSMVPGATAIKGKDGGQSDTVKTSIEGKQRARVAHGEMYIPPETVKRMGGAKKLYAMMDRVRQQATGSKKQIKPVSLKRAMA